MLESFAKDFRRFFVRGLAVILPTLVTLGLIIYVFGVLDAYFGRYVNVAVQWIVVQFHDLFTHAKPTPRGDPAAWQRLKVFWGKYRMDWVGFLLALGLIYIIGRFVASYIGRTVWKQVETAFFRVPILRQVYPYVKQITDFVLAEHKLKFSRVVAVEYPRKGIWSLGFVTAPGMRAVQARASKESAMLTVFVPSSPTPVTGYAVTIHRDDVIDLPISIDEALRFVVSCGVILPPSQLLAEVEAENALRGLSPLQKKEIPA